MKILRNMVTGLGVVMVILAILLLAFVFIGPRFGWQVYPVMSGSMEPELKVGGIIITAPEKLGNIKVGDIITYDTSGVYKITHRVVDIVEIDSRTFFQTKGDTNEDPDPGLVTSTGVEMEKVVLHVPYLGFAAHFIKGQWAFMALMGIPALILIGMFSRDIREGIREERHKRKVKTARMK